MGEQGPMGPAGIPDTGGIDPIQLAQAHHIAFVIDDADPAMGDQARTLRIGEDRMISAVARAQSGKVLDAIPVTVSVTKDENDAITVDEDGMLEAIAVGKAEVTGKSDIAGISAKLTVTVTKPVKKIVFMVGEGDDATAHSGEEFLAAGQSTAEITAVAHNEDDEVVTVRSNWSWSSDDESVATVAQKKDADKKLVDMGAIGTITGKGEGDAMISATVEGVSGSIEVTVTGQSTTRRLRASTSSMGNTFTWDRGADTPAWNNASSEFRVDLYDTFSGDRITTFADTDLGIAISNDDVNTAVTVVEAAAGGTVTVTVTPPSDQSSADPGTYYSDLTLTATGADPHKIRFTVVIKAAPATN